MKSADPQYDVIVIGGGPAGSTAGMVLAKAGLRAVVLEKSAFPRFHIGESILPFNLPLIQELGLEPELKKLPQMVKLGAEFLMGDTLDGSVLFGFDRGLIPGAPAFNIERAPFDQMLLKAAATAGAEVRENTGVERITRLSNGDVAVVANGEEITARYILDASGHGTVVGKHLGNRRNINDEAFNKVAYFAHFDDVERLPGKQSGYPGIVMSKEGWFWMIGLTEKKTSVGFVTWPHFAKSVDVPANRLLQWAIARCPVVRHRMRNAVGPTTNQVLADFSYTCKPYAGPGYFLIGDAAAFLDPIFSTGVTLAMTSAVDAARSVTKVIKGELSPARAQRNHIRFIRNSTGVFWRLIRASYKHSFRELFLNGSGPLQMHRAVISILAGNVFPKPAWKLRWRLLVFELCVRVNQHVPLVPRRKEFSLLSQSEPETTPQDIAQPSMA